jgi:enoyl-CoA hydratase
MTAHEPDLVLTEVPARHPDTGEPIPHVALLTLNRPAALNALNSALMADLVDRLHELDADPDCHVVVIRGAGDRAFAAGADIREMAALSAIDLTVANPFARWEEVARIRIPIIAAVRGYALGGGCELAMACDMIVAAEDAQFGQPEVKLGIIPGAGGTQRLTRAIGKARAMELILTGRTFGAREAESFGLLTSVVPAGETITAALELAARVAAQPRLAVVAAKQAIARAAELSLSAGLELERTLIDVLFASDDRKEGMAAFLEKRPPHWTGR